LEGSRLEARVTDQGRGFDPSTIPDPTEPENILKSGGRGLFLMRQLLDEVSYNDQGNQVTLVLRLEQGSALEGGAQA
jgi:serine/threonine-protein kinase RsbW